MRVSMPKIVIAAAVIAASLSACTMKGEAGSKVSAKQAAGINSKTGKALSKSEMCALPVTDAAGKTTVASIRFQSNAVMLRRSRVALTASQFVIEKETKGSWSLFGDALLLTENGATVKNPIESYERESDKASCVRFTALEDRPEYCACDFSAFN